MFAMDLSQQHQAAHSQPQVCSTLFPMNPMVTGYGQCRLHTSMSREYQGYPSPPVYPAPSMAHSGSMLSPPYHRATLTSTATAVPCHQLHLLAIPSSTLNSTPLPSISNLSTATATTSTGNRLLTSQRVFQQKRSVQS
ncbi:hypothetical protein DPMN_182953 [Dreissena polymorpha]|uniref:Uncharacterized protein n=1 Tax=Dreissena polymorpha TaxID=45954 RepID=A0A9D4DI64_DREPO|nr:hypothetical protein DPMN_182953 [Dreissena polymorpha]